MTSEGDDSGPSADADGGTELVECLRSLSPDRRARIKRLVERNRLPLVETASGALATVSDPASHDGADAPALALGLDKDGHPTVIWSNAPGPGAELRADKLRSWAAALLDGADRLDRVTGRPPDAPEGERYMETGGAHES